MVSTLVCDTPVSGTTAGATNAIPQYACQNQSAPGGDQVFAFVAPGSGTYGVEVDAATGADLDVAVLFNGGAGCNPALCGAMAATAVDPETLTFNALAGQVVYLAVDSGSAGVTDAFTVEVQCASVTVENCSNSIDGDGDVDCADSNCGLEPSCLPAEICTNNIDDDGDFDIDCADNDCAGDPACVVEICNNGTDDDGDGDADCDDTDCNASIFCAGEQCTNGIDDDLDGDTDCADAQCINSTACGSPVQEICGNGIDDDGDTYIDCTDRSCETDPTCAQEVCGDGTDNDGDGLIDCLDPDCGPDPGCITANCAPGVPIACGASVTGTTSGASATDYYSCGPGLAQLGPENIYSFTSNGEFIEIQLQHSATANLDLMILENTAPTCDPASCLMAAAASQSPETVAVSTQAGSTYHIVVDGPATYDADSYTLDLVCNPAILSFEECGNGTDDDGDGDIDCDDASCAVFGSCIPSEVCNDGVDNDYDAGIDCGDVDCSAATSCRPESCTNGLDDDGDGAIDCADNDCYLNAACP